MIQAVISALPNYLLSILSLTSSANTYIIKKMRYFFWQNTEEKHKIPLIAWDKIMKPKPMGGLGIKDFRLQNIALGAKLVWKFIKNPNASWVIMLATKYLSNQNNLNILRSGSFPKGSRIWNFIISCRNQISKSVSWDIHDGSTNLFWEDSWGGYPSLANIIHIPATKN